MKTWYKRIISVVVTEVMLLAIVSIYIPAKVNALSIYANNLLADKAMEYVGRWGGEACRTAGKLDNDNTGQTVGGYNAGECKTFVNCIVWIVSNRSQWPAPGYNEGFQNVGGLEVNPNDVIKGDIIQVDTPTYLHTAIVYEKKANGVYDVIDSNFDVGNGNNRTVNRHDWIPPSGARFWRMGRADDNWRQQSNGLWTGSPPDGMIVENVEGNHLYVAAGGSLFWFDRSSSYLWETFVAQRRRLHGEIAVARMAAADIHAIEANYPSPRHHVPRDNTYLYEVGTVQQYVVMYGYSFPVGEGDLDYLGGRNRAIAVPSGDVRHFAGLPSIPNDVLLKDHMRSQVYHVIWNTLHHANNDTVIDCVKKVKGGALQPVPVSLIDRLFQAGRYSGGATGCAFPGHWAIHGPGGIERWHIAGNNPYTRSRYIDSLSLFCRLDTAPVVVEISTQGVNSPAEGSPIRCQDNTFVRIAGNGETFQVRNHTLHYIPWPEMLNCLTHGNAGAVIDLDGAIVATTPRGEWAFCDFEGKQIRSPDGRIWWIKQGIRRQLPNDTIVSCLKGRASTGDVLNVAWDTVASHTLGAWAYCPYALGTNFVKEVNNSTVWRVYPDGKRQHANGFCVSDPFTTSLFKYRVWVVPDGEVQGHAWDGSVFGVSTQTCQALPSP